MSDFRRYGRRGWLCGAALLAAVSWGGGAVAADQAPPPPAPAARRIPSITTRPASRGCAPASR
ncbi:MAG: hypothetical protein ABF854_14470, partial [Gluconacetobacter sp.]